MKVLGKDFAEKAIRGCSVHWMRSVNRVAKMVCTSSDEESVFKQLGKIVQELQEKDKVIKVFDVMSGKKDITSASEYLPDNMADKSRNKDISNSSWKKLKHWANWWTSTRHLHLFTKAYTLRETDIWDALSNTTNPVESINRQSFKSRTICIRKYVHGGQSTCCKNDGMFKSRKYRLHLDNLKEKPQKEMI